MTKPYSAKPNVDTLLIELAQRHWAPLSAIIQTTRRCNHACVHCMQVEHAGRELTTTQWEQVLGRLAEAGLLLLTVTGGEPTLRNDWLDLLRLGRRLGFALRLKTNGFALDDEACDALSAIPVLQVDLSFFSADAAVHDAITGTPGSHAKVVAATRRLRRNGTHVLLVCPLMDENACGYERVIAFAKSEQVDFMFDPGITVQEDGCVEPVRHRMSEEAQLRLVSDERIYEPTKPGAAAAKRGQAVCRIGKAMVAVAPNGDVWPCLSIQEKLGNLLESDLKSIWVGNPILEKYASITWDDLPKCRECELLAYCSRCHANAMLEDGDLYGPSKLACQAARLRRAVALARRESKK